MNVAPAILALITLLNTAVDDIDTGELVATVISCEKNKVTVTNHHKHRIFPGAKVRLIATTDEAYGVQWTA